MLRKYSKFTFIKSLRLRMSRKCLEVNYELFFQSFKEMLQHISDEMNLIKQDHLARGKVVEPITVYSEKTDKGDTYKVNTSRCKTKIDINSPVEFWGIEYYTDENFVSNTSRFPWMPVEICDLDPLPF